MRLQVEHISIVRGVRQPSTLGLGITEQSSVLPWAAPKLALYSLTALEGPSAEQTTPVVSEALHAEFARGQQRSVTSALLRAMHAAEDALHRENARSLPQHRCAGALCAAALKGDTAYVAYAGGGVVYAWQGGALRRLGGPDVDLGGVTEYDECEVALASSRLQPGDALLLASRGLLSFVTDESLAALFVKSGAANLADRLEGLHLAAASQEDFAALVLAAAPAEAEARPASRATSTAPRVPVETDERPVSLPAARTAAVPRTTRSLASAAAPPPRSRPAPGPNPSRLAAIFARFRATGDQQREGRISGRHEVRHLASGRPSTRQTGSAASLPYSGPQAQASLSAGQVARGVRTSLVNIMVRFSIAATVLAAIFCALYFGEGAWRARDEQDRARQLVAILEQKERDALAATDPANKRYLLTEASRYAEQVIASDNTNEEAVAIAKRLRGSLDELNAVVRLPALQLLADFAGLDRASRPSRLLVVGDDIYVLDRGAGTVWQLTVGTDLGLAAPPRALWKRGDSLDGIALGDALAAFWMYGGAPGLPEQVYALDSNGVLVRLGKDKASQAMRLPAAAALPLVRGALGQAGNLYILDPQRRLVWRYVPGGAGYDRPPQEYLSELAAPDLGNAIDMASDGNLYLLFADGQISRYSGGTGQPFPAIVPDAALRNPTGIFASPATRYLYVADAGNARVVRFTKEGQYVNQYRAPNDEFDDLRAAYVDEQKARLFTIVGSRVFVSELPPDTRP